MTQPKHFAVAITISFLTVVASGAPVQAAFHLWTFTEFFSNADGSVQFIEMHSPANGEHFADGAEIRSMSTGQVFAFPGNLSSSQTANKHLLIATADFGSLPGGVAPDLTLPSNFFNPDGDTVSLFSPSFSTFHSRTFPFVPTDGVESRHFPTNTLAVNSPTNFAGEVGSVDLSPPPTFAADFNNDGMVDGDDLVIWETAFGENPLADADGDGVSDGHDFLIWQRQFGSELSSNLSESHAVPEPTAVALLLPLLMAAVCRRSVGY